MLMYLFSGISNISLISNGKSSKSCIFKMPSGKKETDLLEEVIQPDRLFNVAVLKANYNL